jgi:hypothetical protein
MRLRSSFIGSIIALVFTNTPVAADRQINTQLLKASATIGQTAQQKIALAETTSSEQNVITDKAKAKRAFSALLLAVQKSCRNRQCG